MVRIENECVGCDYPCMGKRACPLTHVKRMYCDKCHDEVSKLYWLDDGSQVCADCINEMFGDMAEENFQEVEADEDDYEYCDF